jgi:hypothetical protein
MSGGRCVFGPCCGPLFAWCATWMIRGRRATGSITQRKGRLPWRPLMTARGYRIGRPRPAPHAAWSRISSPGGHSMAQRATGVKRFARVQGCCKVVIAKERSD